MEVGVVFPVASRPALVSLANALMGERKAEYEASQVSVVRESWFVQPTPQGEVVIVHFEAADPAAVFSGLASSDEPFDVWFREQVLIATGVDLSTPPEGLPEQIFHWSRA